MSTQKWVPGTVCPKCQAQWVKLLYVVAPGTNEGTMPTSESCPVAGTNTAHLHAQCSGGGWVCPFLTADTP